MIFTETEAPVTELDIARIERSLNLRLPEALRRQYLENNGGCPDPYMYEDNHAKAVVTLFMPLVAAAGKGTAVDTYRNLATTKRIIPQNMFPFAAEAGGDYFVVDCDSSDGRVYLYRHDTAYEHLVRLDVTIDVFWDRLVPE